MSAEQRILLAKSAPTNKMAARCAGPSKGLRARNRSSYSDEPANQRGLFGSGFDMDGFAR